MGGGHGAGRQGAGEDRGNLTAGRSAMLSHSWCFISAFPEPFVLPVTVLNLQTMAVIVTVVGVYSVRLLFGFLLDLCGVSFSSSGPWLECLNGSLSLSGWLRGEP